MVVSLVWMDGSLCDMAGGVELVAPHNSTYEPFFVFCTWNTANTHTTAQSKMNNSWPVKWCVVVTALRPSKPKQLCNGPCAAQYPFRYVFFFCFLYPLTPISIASSSCCCFCDVAVVSTPDASGFSCRATRRIIWSQWSHAMPWQTCVCVCAHAGHHTHTNGGIMDNTKNI